MKTDSFAVVMDVIGRLEFAKISFCLRYVRESSIQIEAFVPGQHWEIDVYDDGTVDFEVFQSSGTVLGDKELNEQIEKFRD